MATREEIRLWCESTRPRDWYGVCAGLTYQTIYYNGGYAPDVYPSAWAAWLDAPAGNLDAGACPPGGIHYFDYTDSAGNRYGHVMVDIDGGGGACLSATHYAVEYWGVSAGLISVWDQDRHGGMTYVGWTETYGRRNRITIGEDDMPEMSYETFSAYLWRALKWDVRQDALGADGANGPTVWDQLGGIRNDVASIQLPPSGEIDYPQLASALADAGITVVYVDPRKPEK